MTTLPPILPSKQSAIIADDDGELHIRHEVPMPAIGADCVLIKVMAVALNPVDTKMIQHLATAGATSGFDFAGIVAGYGDEVTEWPIGLRVCGAVNGQNRLNLREGAFSQYTTVPAHALLGIPDGMSFEDASTLGVSVGTAGLALFRSFPSMPPLQVVLVYGGSSATGAMAIQLLKIFGYIPITTCSPRNFELVKSRGAEEVFDYRSSSAINDIRQYTGNRLKYILDCITTAETISFCQSCMGRMGGIYTTTEPFPRELLNTSRIKHDWVLQPEVLGKPIGWPDPFGRSSISQETKDWAITWYKTIQHALDAGQLRTHPTQLRPDGMKGILSDMELLTKRQVSGAKLVYTI